MASLGSPLKPDHRLTIVLRYASAVYVVVPELKLGDGVTLVCSLPKPRYCLGIVLRHTSAVAIQGKNIQHTVRYTELSPDRFKDFWR